MAFERAPTAESMLSRQWSTGEMYEGLAHILTDAKAELPDDVSHLEARWQSSEIRIVGAVGDMIHDSIMASRGTWGRGF